MIPLARSSAQPLCALLFLSLLSCGGGGGAPSNPSTPPATTPPITTPPAPVNPPLSATCNRLAIPSTGGKEECAPQNPDFLDAVDQAIDTLIAEQPQIFDLNQFAGPGGYLVLSEGAYFVGVIQNLDKQGYCGGLYSEELAVTNTLGFSENYDILDAKHFARRGANSYRSTCTPAAYSTEKPPPGNTPGCNLAASLSVACSREGVATFGQVVADAQAQVVREQPQAFDTTQVQPGAPGDWYRVKDDEAYVQGVVRAILARGVCARWDGEEVNVKTSNVNSENYDILTAQGFMRRGDGAYRVTCYPAYF